MQFQKLKRISDTVVSAQHDKLQVRLCVHKDYKLLIKDFISFPCYNFTSPYFLLITLGWIACKEIEFFLQTWCKLISGWIRIYSKCYRNMLFWKYAFDQLDFFCSILQPFLTSSSWIELANSHCKESSKTGSMYYSVTYSLDCLSFKLFLITIWLMRSKLCHKRLFTTKKQRVVPQFQILNCL
jgi:hypothetical protein